MPIFYEVWVASSQYHKPSALTYHSDQALVIGSIVKVPLKDEQALAVVIAEVQTPKFTTKGLVHLGWPALPLESLELITWLRDYYPAPFGNIVQQFLPSSLLSASGEPT